MLTSDNSISTLQWTPYLVAGGLA